MHACPTLQHRRTPESRKHLDLTSGNRHAGRMSPTGPMSPTPRYPARIQPGRPRIDLVCRRVQNIPFLKPRPVCPGTFVLEHLQREIQDYFLPIHAPRLVGLTIVGQENVTIAHCRSERHVQHCPLRWRRPNLMKRIQQTVHGSIKLCMSSLRTSSYN